MGKAFFKGAVAVFLPMTEDRRVAKRFRAWRGKRERYVTQATTHVIVDSWDAVQEHFAPFLGLLPYFQQRVYFVHSDWVQLCLDYSRCMLDGKFDLEPDSDLEVYDHVIFDEELQMEMDRSITVQIDRYVTCCEAEVEVFNEKKANEAARLFMADKNRCVTRVAAKKRKIGG